VMHVVQQFQSLSGSSFYLHSSCTVNPTIRIAFHAAMSLTPS